MPMTDLLINSKSNPNINFPIKFKKKNFSKEESFINSFYSYDFSPWKFNNNQLETLFLEPFSYYDFINQFCISDTLLRNFFKQVSGLYHSSNDFHNFYHGFSVFQNIFSLLIHGYDTMLTDLEIFCLLIASICHDIGHTGKNSAFEVATNTEIGKNSGNNPSIVMEVYHSKLTKEIISKTHLLASFSHEEEIKILNIIEEIILSTAMSDHNNLISNSKELFSMIETCNIYKNNSFSSDISCSRHIGKKKSFCMIPEVDSADSQILSTSPIFDSPLIKKKNLSSNDIENSDGCTDYSSFYSSFSRSSSLTSSLSRSSSQLNSCINIDNFNINDIESQIKSVTTTRSSLETDNDIESSEDNILDFPPEFSNLNVYEHERLNDEHIKDIYNDNLRKKILKLLMHSSDLSAQTQSPSLAITWSKKCYDEFLKQASIEKNLGIVTTPFLHDLDSKSKRANSQILFINHIVAPLWDIIINIMPSLSFIRENIKNNLKIYEENLEA